MEDHGICRDQLFALQPVDQKAGGLGKIEPGKLFADGVEAFDRAAVVVLVVATEFSPTNL